MVRLQEAKVDEYLKSQGWAVSREFEAPALAAFPVPEGLPPVMRRLVIAGAVESYARVQVGLPPEDVEPSTSPAQVDAGGVQSRRLRNDWEVIAPQPSP